MAHLNAFFRLDDGAEPAVEVDGVPCAELQDVERHPQAYLDHLRRRAERTPASSFYHRDFYDHRLRIRTAGGWRRLDPSDAPFVSNERQTLEAVLRWTQLRLFEPGEPVIPSPGPWAQRYDLAWGVESGGLLRVRRRTLESKEPELATLFRLMTRNRTPEADLPATLVREAASLRGAVREETTSYPLRDLALETRDLLERLTLLNHFIYWKTIDAVVARFHPRHPSEFCAWGIVTTMDLPAFVERVRARYPGYEIHPTLKDQTVAYLRPTEPLETFVANRIEPVPLDDVLISGRRFRHRPYPDSLATVLQFIRCELRFVRFEIDGEVADEEEVAIALADAVPEIAGTWTAPRAARVDAGRFWIKEVWKKGTGGGRSTGNMDAFRFALYDPPYGGVSAKDIELFEPEIFETLFGAGHEPSHFATWSVDPKQSSWFVHEWWDYCWVLFNRGRREVIVAYGTATD